MATLKSVTLGGSQSSGYAPGATGMPKKTGTAVVPPVPVKPPAPVPGAMKPGLDGYVPPVTKPLPPGIGGPTPILPPPAETAVAAPVGSTITSYAGGAGPQPQILPKPPETAVPAGPGTTITSYAGGAGPQINPPAPETATPINGSQPVIGSNPAPNVQPPPPMTGYGPITGFGADNNLIGTQVNPTVSGRTGDTMSAVDAARNALSGGPNRSQLADQYTSQWNNATQPEFQADLRDATKMAAANGRLGSGMLTTRYGDITAARDAARTNAQAGFRTDALAGTIQDRLNNVNALSGLEGQQYGQDAANRGEVRGERGYQYGLSRDAQGDRVTQATLEDQLQGNQFGRDQQLTDMLLRYGFGGGLTPTLQNGAGQAQTQATNSGNDVADLLAAYFGRGG